MKGGYRQAEMKLVAQAVEKAGADIINVTAGWHQSFIPLITMDVPRGTFVYLAKGTKEVVKVPVIACNRINNPLLAEQILQDGQADMIGMARALLTDPELPNKAAEGRFDAILLNGAVPAVSAALLEQIADGGRLVAMLEQGPVCRAQVWYRSGKAVNSQPAFDGAAAPLPGFEAPAEFVL